MLCSKRGPDGAHARETKGSGSRDFASAAGRGLRATVAGGGGTVCDVNCGQLMLLRAEQDAQFEVHVLKVLRAGAGLWGGGVIVWRTAQERVTCDV